MSTPPLIVHTRARVLRVAHINGLSVTILSSLASVVSLLFGDWSGFAIGLFAIASGVMELHGRKRLVKGDNIGAAKWLPRSQLWLLSVITVYAVTRLASFASDTILDNLSPDMKALLDQIGMDANALVPLVRKIFYAFYGSVLLVTWLYQGLMWRFYRKSLAKIETASSSSAQ